MTEEKVQCTKCGKWQVLKDPASCIVEDTWPKCCGKRMVPKMASKQTIKEFLRNYMEESPVINALMVKAKRNNTTVMEEFIKYIDTLLEENHA